MRVLLVEDDPILGVAVRDQIAADGHSVDWVRRLDEAGDSVRTVAYELILLDLMLPDGRGLDFLRAHRAAGDVTPVIILTARDQISDRIAGLNTGADDYLVKPFDLSELSARIGAVARRYVGNPGRSGWTGDRPCCTFDPSGRAPCCPHRAGMGLVRGSSAASPHASVQSTTRRAALFVQR